MIADWKAVLESLPNGVLVKDSEETIQLWNQAMERLSGYSKRTAIGQTDSFLRCVPTNGSNETVPANSAILDRTSSTESVQCILQQRDGSSAPVLRSVSQVRDSGGNVLGTVWSFTDLRPLKALPSPVVPISVHGTNGEWEDGLIGNSQAMREVRERIAFAAESNATVLILGETGTGKELVAEAVHLQGERRKQRLIKVNCSALPETLLESELFGHVKGAFTGAIKDKPGRFELAQGGTLFLDEIGDLSPLIQLKLLRVLQHREFERVGESRVRRVDVRVIVATHRDLRRWVDEGRFRQDLFYRLNVFPIHVPPLRERATDIPLLVEHFLERFNRATGKSIVQLSADAGRILMDFCWPGNVRQLENAIEHAFVTCRGPEVGLFDLPVEIRKTELRRQICDETLDAVSRRGISYEDGRLIKEPAKQELLAWLEECRYNKSEVARRTGVDRSTVWRWMKRLGIPSQPPPNS